MTTEQIENLYELSPMQRGMLFHTLYAPHSGVYIGQFVCKLEGRLDAKLFYEVWQRIILRHPPLRTAFLWMDVDEPLQVVYRSVPSAWREENWQSLSESEQWNRLETSLAEDRKQGFDLTHAPLLRLLLLHLSNEACYFVCSHHHILLDGWSLVAVLQEVFSLYEALHSGRETILEQRRLFSDYIGWLRRHKLEEAEVFWRSYLQGFTTPTSLPISDHSWSEDAALLHEDEGNFALQRDGRLERHFQGGRPVRLRGFTFSNEETEALRLSARYHQVTLNTLFQGAWAILLSRYSGEQDVVFGATVAGRPLDLAGSEKMIGLFINTLPVRVQVTSYEEVDTWLRYLQEQQLEARQYDYSPLVQVQGWSEVSRDLPLFESLVVFENYPLDRTQDEGNSIHITSVQTLEQTNYPLVLVVGTGARGLTIQLGYEIARFSVPAIERMLEQLRTILVELMQRSIQYLGDITLPWWEEQQRLLKEWSSTRAYGKAMESPSLTERPGRGEEADEAVTVMNIVRAQALQTPDKVALVCGDCSLTYGELERRSNQLAHNLRNLEVGVEICVGVCMGRSSELAIALLGILKAGGVYLPLDPGFPQARLAFMLSETQAPIVLTQTEHEKLFEAMTMRTVCIDVERELPIAIYDDPPAIEIQPENAAYIIYTSGSTGTPKGVVVSHSALLNHAEVVGTAYNLREQDRVLQFASTSFDVSLEELLPSWTHGASVVMWHETIVPSMREFADFIEKEALSVLNLPSTYWHEWVTDLARTHVVLPAGLRLVVIGSERALAVRLALWQRLVGERVALYNAYGLTETTITALLYAPGWIATPDENHVSVPVGRPLPGIQAYVLDERLQPMPPGMPGELYIGGTCLGRGYLHNAALTAGRFLPDPFSTTSGARLYRTGDRARVITGASATTSEPGSIIELLGRTDTQVKVRGFRIEPAEVESQLLQHPSVREALVLAREDTPGETVLVAYIVVSEQHPALVTRLRHYLQDILPSYMIPAFFVPLKALPRSSGGKVNIRSLPSPQQKLTQSDIYIPPRTPVEEILAVIWCEVLHLERAGRTDHFFKLGGHSLQATQVVARLRETLQIELPVRAVYDASTIAALAIRIEQERQRAAGQRVPAIQSAERNAPLPLSFAQQRLWFLDQFEPDNPFYSMPGMLYLRGSLNVASLERSLQDLVQRHEALRTTFALREGQPVQIIAAALPLTLQVIQLAGSDGMSQREEMITDLAREEARQPFNLERGPLMRATLVRLNEQEHVLLLTLHHIVADGWSMEILLQELSACYTANLSGQPVTLPSLPIQYADYAAWQHSWLQGPILEQQLAYWRRQLADAPLMLPMPTDRPRPAFQTYNGAIYMFHLPLSLTQRLHTLSREEGVTPFMALLAAFQILLFRYSNQSDIVVGTPTSGRTQRETEGVVGLFLNMLALRTEVNAELTYRELLQRVHNMTLDAYMHQDVPFEKLVEELQPERSLSHTPFFQVMLVWQNMPVGSIELPGLSLETFGVESNTAKFDLTLGVRETSSGLRCFVEYNTDLFDEATIARMAGHLQTLLESCTANPQVRLADMSLLTQAERRQVLVEWNDTRQELSAHCMHHIIEGWARTTPDAIALVYEAEQLTYACLNESANRLAHYLQSLGIGPDERVGLLLKRSLAQIVCILGILKAGGAYVYLDPAYPQERLAFMLEDAAISVLLAHEELRQCLPPCQGLHEVYLERERERIARYTATNPSSDVQPDNLTYMMYTSGSTGRPKGVMVTHRGLCNLAQAQATRRGEQTSTRAIQWLSLSFDASLTEIATALQAGATLCMGDREQLQDSEDLLAFLAREAITTLSIPPPALALLPQADLPHVSRIIVGAEPFSGELVARWSQGRRFFNEYGPTETTVSATVAECRGAEQPSIGRPLANVQVYLLDSYLQPVPVGLPGELYIGGMGLARGYHRRPDLTAERFIPNPFSVTHGARLYRTGDLARYRPDGEIEFLGRVDRQVKLRSYRIEPGEVEAAVEQHPSLRASAVLVREDTPGDRKLVAYVVPITTSQPSPAELRTFLQQRLPWYMIPAAFVSLPVLPLTPNGKTDYGNLPAPLDTRTVEQELRPSLPHTPVEEVLASIWSGLLHREQIDANQNFFDLGGHSLLATQVVSRIRELFCIDMPLRVLFEAPTLAELTVQIEQALHDKQGLTVPPLIPVSREQELPLSFAQQRLWFLDQLDPGSSLYTMPLALRLEGSLDIIALARSLHELEQRHESLRTIFQNRDGHPIQVILPAGNSTLCCVDLRSLRDGERNALESELVQQEARKSFDLSRGPLLRMTLLLLDTDEHILLCSLHHIVSDGWSMEILVRDLFSLYAAFRQGHTSPLPELPLQYVDFAAWQRQWLSGAVLEAHVDYWQRQLAHAPTLELPTDRVRQPVQTDNGAIRSLSLSPDLSQHLRTLGLREGTTLFMTLLAAFSVLLARYSGQEDITIGSPVANRNHASVENLIGFFVNMLVLRTNLSDYCSFREVLRRVRTVCLEAYTHQDLPFEQLVEILQPERDLSRNPLFQVLFALHHPSLFTGIEESTSLTVSGIVEEQVTAKFDLSLDVTETRQGLFCTIEYNTDLFDHSTIERLLGHWRTLLESLVANPEADWRTLQLLKEEERRQFLIGRNTGMPSLPSLLSIQKLFEARAARTPQALAVVHESIRMTYDQLNRAANRLAHYLQSLDVEPEVRVGILLDHPVEQVISLLAVLKAGGAYVPLDANLPRERLAFMLRDAGISLLLTEQRLAERVPAGSSSTLCLDACRADIERCCADNPAESSIPAKQDTATEELAYIIYTSGSTGLPKGAMITRKNLASAFYSWEHLYSLSEGGTHLQMAHFSFDVFTGNVVRALCSGGTLVICPREKLLNPEQLYHLMLQEQVDCAEFVPAVLNNLVDYLEESQQTLAFMRLLIAGSESWSVQEYQRVKRLCSEGTTIFNSYGLTETTIDSLCFQGEDMLPSSVRTVPVGRPLDNTRCYLLDAELQEVPTGIPGEIYIGGAGVGRGYTSRPDLTAERFIPDPFALSPGERIYRTGDRARYLPDGSIECLGRIDQQVKIRGFRIEPGEIETVLADHPDIRSAAALVREDGPGHSNGRASDKLLTAYLVPRQPLQNTQDAGVLLASMRQFLQNRLPDYMLPAAWVLLDTLPLTASGKIDYRSLPMPASGYQDDNGDNALSTPVEEAVAHIWAEVLDQDAVLLGRNAHFFALGGHSLLATRVIARVRRDLQVEIPLRTLFEFPTIESFADAIVQQELAAADSELLLQMVEELEDAPDVLSKINTTFSGRTSL